MRAIIADDSYIYRERLNGLLCEIPGIDVVAETEDVPNTIQAVRRFQPDILLMDIQMPGGSGIDVLKELKTENILPNTVIVITNYPYPQYRDRCLKEGAHYFFDKTNESERVIETVIELIHRNHNVLDKRISPLTGETVSKT